MRSSATSPSGASPTATATATTCRACRSACWRADGKLGGHADPPTSRDGRLRARRAAPRRPAAGPPRGRGVPRGPPAGERRARHARLHRQLRGPAGVGAGNRHGVSQRGDRDRGARAAGGGAPDPDRYLRRAAARPGAGRHRDRPVGGTRRRDPPPLHPRRAASPPPPAGEPHAPTAHFGLTHGAIHAAKGLGIRPQVGAIASSDTFYDPDPGRHLRWAERGVLAVEMEAAVLFTIGALRSVKTACILTVSDLVGSTQLVRIADNELALGVERMTRLALAAAVDAKS